MVTNSTPRDSETEVSKFSQTLQSNMADPSAPEKIIDEEMLELERKNRDERTKWVITVPDPPGSWNEAKDFVKEITMPGGNNLSSFRNQPVRGRLVSVLKAVFPPLQWCQSYNLAFFKNDLLSGLTLASLCIPQGIGYATLARLDPQYGLYTSVIPPLIYAVMGTSKELGIGPVAVSSMIFGSMMPKVVDPASDPATYTSLVLTSTLFAGLFQASFGIFRLGFLVDFLSHAAIVGFMAGAAIVIGFQQLKGLLGLTQFINKTDVISVSEAVWKALHNPWSPFNVIVGGSFLIFMLVARIIGKRNKKFFWLPALAPLLSVILATLLVYFTRADNHGVRIIKHIKGGLNPSSAHELQLKSPHLGQVAKIGLVVGAVALTEAIAVGRSFASLKGYHLDGNKEMVAMGLMNIIGSLTSCYVATGSFSRTAVNFSAGCKTPVSNVVMAITVLVALQFFTKLLYFTPTAILASIILAALPGLVNFREAYNIWKVDKLDFLACIGAFFGVLFTSVEIGLIVAVMVSFAKIILISIRPGIEKLGRVPGTDAFCSVDQYPMAVMNPGVMIIRIKSSLLCFANANLVRERIVQWVTQKEVESSSISDYQTIRLVILDMSDLRSIDTSGIASLKELQTCLVTHGVEVAIANPKWHVVHKLRVANLIDKLGGRIYLTVKEAVDASASTKLTYV